MIIASVATLKVLNGTEIAKTERYGSELDYLKMFGLNYLRAKKEGSLEAFFSRHPRYPKFVRSFGEPEEEELETAARMANATLTSNFVEVNVHCPSRGTTTKRKLPPGLTLHKLRALLQRMVRPVKAHQLVLSYSSAQHVGTEVPMDNDLRDLSFYGVTTGDTLFVRWEEK